MLGNGIQCTTTTTGTGPITVAALANTPQPSDVLGDAAVVPYYLVDGSTPPQKEWGLATWSASGGSFARTFIAQTEINSVSTSAPNATAVNLAGTSTFSVTPIAGTQVPGRRATVASGMVTGNPQLAAAFPDGYQVPQGGTAAANRIYLSEYIHKSPRAIKAFRAYSGSASGNINFALYKLNIDGTIGKQICTTGSKPVVSGLTSYALAAPIWLPPDAYVCVVQVDNGSASFRLAYGCGNTFFGPDSSGNSVAFMSCDPGSFALPSPSWSGSLTEQTGNAGPAVFVEFA